MALHRVYSNDRLRTGDLVYLLFGDSGVYAWGYITGIERYHERDLDKEMMKVLISRPIIQYGLVSASDLSQTEEIAGITGALEGNFVPLTE